MITRVLLIAALAAAPAAVAAQSTDLFEIALTRHDAQGAAVGVLHVEADQLEVLQCCAITLRRGSDAVATFQSNQVSLVVNRSIEGDRVFEVSRSGGQPVQVRADRMVPHQHGLVYFYARGRLVGVASQNSTQMVIDLGALVDEEGRPLDSPPPVRREQ